MVLGPLGRKAQRVMQNWEMREVKGLGRAEKASPTQSLSRTCLPSGFLPSSPHSSPSYCPCPEEAPVQKVSLAQNTRYYLSCPIESRHATYSWRHEENVEQNCEPGHQSPNCVLFIENLTARQYGHYRCEALEGSYLRETQHWELVPYDRSGTAQHLQGHACLLATSLWLGVLPTLALSLLLH